MVEIVNWNPKKPVFRKKPFCYLPIKKTVNNFGDLIGPMVVNKILDLKQIPQSGKAESKQGPRLLAVGSILHFAETDDCIWGTGRNGKIDSEKHGFDTLDVRAVRGPLTREFLLERGIECPEVYGDPALLLPYLFPEFKKWLEEPQYETTVIPNLNDMDMYKKHENVIHPQLPVLQVIERILKSRFVTGSSLHAMIVADAFGIPARLIASRAENIFKYQDYYYGSGRNEFKAAKTVDEAIALGGETPIDWTPQLLLDSFPVDLWAQ